MSVSAWLDVHIKGKRGALDLDVQFITDARVVALIGPNGAGKTTTLRAVAGLFTPVQGRIVVQSRVLFDGARDVDAELASRRCGYLPQRYALFPHLSVIDNVAFGAMSRNQTPRDEARRAALTMLNDMGIGSLADRSPGQLSGGQQQCVALARALLSDPAFFLLDEPLAALDASARHAMRRLVADHVVEQDTPLLMVSHDAADVLQLNAHVIVVEAGRVTAEGPARSLATTPPCPFASDFFAATRLVP